MQVTNTTNPAAQLAAATDPAVAPNGAALQISNMANTSTFLQLLVAQLKNQDPMKPTDSVQFVTQLAQFSSLEQLIGIRGELGTLTPAASDPANKSTV